MSRPPSMPYQLFMLALSILVLVWLAVDIFFEIDPDLRRVLLYADTAVALVFMADFFASLYRAESRLKYMVTWGWLDFLSSIPMVESLRIARGARIARIFRVLRAVRSLRMIARMAYAQRSESALLAAVTVAFLAIVVGAMAVLIVERPAGGNITTAEDALWWAVVTISTVGYGDFYPTTTEGRLIAAAMIFVGIGLFGTLTGFVATWLVAPVSDGNAAASGDEREGGRAREG